MSTATLDPTAIKERPILFSGAMVKAILEGRKTQTRRAIRKQPLMVKHMGTPDGHPGEWGLPVPGRTAFCLIEKSSSLAVAKYCPYGQPGDRLWVRETWAPVQPLADGVLQYEGARLVELDGYPIEVWFRADGELGPLSYCCDDGPRWKPSIHMPRAASRLTLEVTEVRVQRLQDISEENAIAEGAQRFDDLPSIHPWGQDPRWSMEQPLSTEHCLNNARFAFANFWNKLNADKHPWDSNPWVWAVSFRPVEA